MKAELISIGDELLIGQTVNTNAAWLGKELSFRGVQVCNGVTISDKKEVILDALDVAVKRADLVIITGGLGPTKDDITKHTLCEYFEKELEINKEVLDRVEAFFKQRNRPMLEVNVQQAALPIGTEVLHNYHGTASGMWFEKSGVIVISLPGVPYEMKGIMMDEVFPRLQDQFGLSSIYHKTIHFQGIGESFLADQIQDWESSVRDEGLGLAYLPSPGIVKLRLTSLKGEVDAEKMDEYFDTLKKQFPINYFGEGEITMNEVVADLLINNNKTVGTVESCTGGNLAASFVSLAGSSSYYKGSFLTYSNELKELLVGVSRKNLATKGAVSEEVVIEMAEKGRLKLGVDFCIATSGIAGPDGGTEEKSVGTVWIALASSDGVVAKKFLFGNNRQRNLDMAVLTALNLLRIKLLSNK
ncbi:MAG: competence/damage-inducible protein A [Crocinitomicaceae bacterium]